MWVVHVPGSSVDRQMHRTAADGSVSALSREPFVNADNRARIFDGDMFAGAIPAGVNQISLRASPYCFTSTSAYRCRVQRQNAAPKQAEKGRGVCRDAAFGAGPVLAVKPDRKRYCVWLAVASAQHAEGVRRQEDNLAA